MDSASISNGGKADKVFIFIGLSGVGKTSLARKLSNENWFHYSVDYRIWTHYLGDELNDYLKKLAMQNPILQNLLKKDAITVEHRVHFDNLLATSLFMGMLGNPELAGSTLSDFNVRMKKHADAEVAAMQDMVAFKERSKELYGYPNLIVDASGSVCEIINPDDDDDQTLQLLNSFGTTIYLRASAAHKEELLRRAAIDPKPIYYRPEFLDEHIPGLLKTHSVSSVTELDPKEVGAYLYPRLLEARIERYEKIAKKTGVIIEMDEAIEIQNEPQLIELIDERSK